LAPDTARDLDLLVEAAQDGGRIAIEYFRREVEVWDKGAALGPVSAADMAVNAMLERRLRAARPGYGWLSEETEDTPARLEHARIFIVDPIDGTRAFIKGEPGWGVALAVVEHGHPVAAVMHMPARNETFAARRGAGATLDGVAIRVSGRRRLAGATCLGPRSLLRPEHWPGGSPALATHFRSSLIWRLCLVAAGRFDMAITLNTAWEWDLAAGCLIATEGGATITDRDGVPLSFNGPTARAPGVIAASPALHAALMARRAEPA